MATKAAAQALPVADPAPLTRQQALKEIEHPEPAVRRAAAARLGEVGAMRDADRLVGRLRDDDAMVRQLAEAWNKRATAYYLLGRFELSMRDCDEVLKRNRNRFGALAGYGQMYLAQGDIDRAQSYFERAFKLNPNMAGVRAALFLIERHRQARQRRTI